MSQSPSNNNNTNSEPHESTSPKSASPKITQYLSATSPLSSSLVPPAPNNSLGTNDFRDFARSLPASPVASLYHKDKYKKVGEFKDDMAEVSKPRRSKAQSIFSGHAAEDDQADWTQRLAYLNKKSTRHQGNKAKTLPINAANMRKVFDFEDAKNNGLVSPQKGLSGLTMGVNQETRNNASNDTLSPDRHANSLPIKGYQRPSLTSVVDWKPFDRHKSKTTLLAHQFSQPIPDYSTLAGRQSLSPKAATHAVKSTNLVSPYQIADSTLNDGQSSGQKDGNGKKPWYMVDNEFTRGIIYIQSTQTFLAINILVTLFSLFARDFTLAFLPKAADTAISIILLVIFLYYCFEILFQIATQPQYFLRFYFWLDLIGTVSLTFDIEFLAAPLIYSSASTASLNKSTNALKLSRVTRILRIVRLIRVVKLLKLTNKIQSALNSNINASKVGLHLSELVDKRVILMILSLLIILPFFSSSDTAMSNSPLLGLDIIDGNSNNRTMQNAVVTKYLDYHSNLIYLQVSTDYFGPRVNALHQYNYLRDIELADYRSSSGSKSVLNIRDNVFADSGYSMLITLFIIILFCLGTIIISKDIYYIVVAPLDRMSNIINKLAGTICFLQSSSAQETEALKSDKTTYETSFIEAIMQRLAQIFTVEPDHSSNLDKALQTMAGSKRTEIKTNNSVVSIEVIERPRERDLALSDVLNSPNNVAFIEPDIALYPELSSIHSILSTPELLPHFRLYITSNLLVENLLFYQEIERFKAIFQLHTYQIYDNFVSTQSNMQINIHSKQINTIRAGLDSPNASIFNEAQLETMQLMKQHYKLFIDSKFCQQYLRAKQRAYPSGFGSLANFNEIGKLGKKASNLADFLPSNPQLNNIVAAPIIYSTQNNADNKPQQEQKTNSITINVTGSEKAVNKPTASQLNHANSATRHLSAEEMDPETRALVFPGAERMNLVFPGANNVARRNSAFKDTKFVTGAQPAVAISSNPTSNNTSQVNSNVQSASNSPQSKHKTLAHAASAENGPSASVSRTQTTSNILSNNNAPKPDLNRAHTISQKKHPSAAAAAAGEEELDDFTRRLINPGADALNLIYAGDEAGKRAAQMKVLPAQAKEEPGERIIQQQTAKPASQQALQQPSKPIASNKIVPIVSSADSSATSSLKKKSTKQQGANPLKLSPAELEAEIDALVNPGRDTINLVQPGNNPSRPKTALTSVPAKPLQVNTQLAVPNQVTPATTPNNSAAVKAGSLAPVALSSASASRSPSSNANQSLAKKEAAPAHSINAGNLSTSKKQRELDEFADRLSNPGAEAMNLIYAGDKETRKKAQMKVLPTKPKEEPNERFALQQKVLPSSTKHAAISPASSSPILSTKASPKHKSAGRPPAAAADSIATLGDAELDELTRRLVNPSSGVKAASSSGSSKQVSAANSKAVSRTITANSSMNEDQKSSAISPPRPLIKQGSYKNLKESKRKQEELEEFAERLLNPGGEALNLIYAGDKEGRKQAQMKVIATKTKEEPNEQIAAKINAAAIAAAASRNTSPPATAAATSSPPRQINASSAVINTGFNNISNNLNTMKKQRELDEFADRLINPGAEAVNLIYAADKQGRKQAQVRVSPNKTKEESTDSLAQLVQKTSSPNNLNANRTAKPMISTNISQSSTNYYNPAATNSRITLNSTNNTNNVNAANSSNISFNYQPAQRSFTNTTGQNHSALGSSAARPKESQPSEADDELARLIYASDINALINPGAKKPINAANRNTTAGMTAARNSTASTPALAMNNYNAASSSTHTASTINFNSTAAPRRLTTNTVNAITNHSNASSNASSLFNSTSPNLPSPSNNTALYGRRSMANIGAAAMKR
jgi:hypothetical protein